MANAYKLAILVMAALLLAFIVASLTFWHGGHLNWVSSDDYRFGIARGIITFLVTMIAGVAYIGSRKK